MNRYGIIMAGGSGTRFWPLSRKKLPKQFLNLTGKDSMLNETIDRLFPVIPKDQVFVVTNEAYGDVTCQTAAGRLWADHILSDPAARNTAACIGYAAMEIIKKYGDGVMGIFASDHYIRDEAGFRAVLEQAMTEAEETDRLITIGIRPTFPSTGYGYIRRKGTAALQNDSLSAASPALPVYMVEEFVEKPDAETAKRYLDSGNYLWNSGMFVWKASVILRQFKQLLPDIYACLTEIGESMGTERERETIARVYPGIHKISIDYGIMERAENVVVLEGDFGWNDVGSLDALGALYAPDENGNRAHGEQISLDAPGCISYGRDKLITLIGVENLIVVEGEDTILVCDKDRAQDVKQVVEQLETCGKMQYL